jgi:hypothetical protein
MRHLVSLSLLVLVACGGSSSGGGGTTTDTVAQLTISATGIKTQTGQAATFSVPNPGNVMFINNDTTAHSITSSSTGCSSLNTGTIPAGSSTTTITLINTTSGNVVCAFSDAANPAPAFSGSITILTSSTGGSGY